MTERKQKRQGKTVPDIRLAQEYYTIYATQTLMTQTLKQLTTLTWMNARRGYLKKGVVILHSNLMLFA
jgi:hypothetical protein